MAAGEVVQPAGARRRRWWGRKVEGRREAGMVERRWKERAVEAWAREGGRQHTGFIWFWIFPARGVMVEAT